MLISLRLPNSDGDGEIFDAVIDVDLDYNDVTQTIEALAYSSFLRINKRYDLPSPQQAKYCS